MCEQIDENTIFFIVIIINGRTFRILAFFHSLTHSLRPNTFVAIKKLISLCQMRICKTVYATQTFPRLNKLRADDATTTMTMAMATATTTTTPPLPPKTIAVATTTTPCLPSCPLLHRAFVIYLFSVCVACCVSVFFLLFRLTVDAFSALWFVCWWSGFCVCVPCTHTHTDTHRSCVDGTSVIECSCIVALGSTILAPRYCVAQIQLLFRLFRMHFVDMQK